MPPNNEADRARAELDRLRSLAIETLVDLHPQALPRALARYGSLLLTADIAEVMIRREKKLSLRHEAELAALRRRHVHARSWRALLPLLAELLKRDGRS